MNLSTDPSPSKATEKGKFLFDLSFDSGVSGRLNGLREETDPMLTIPTSALDAAKAEAYAAGVAAGQAEAAASQQVQMNMMLDVLSTKLQALATAATQMHAARDEAIANAIKAIAHKLLPAYATKNGLQEIESIVAKTLADLRDEPRMVVRVSDAHVDECAERLPNLAKSLAFPGQLIILGDPTLGASDCRLEWADGGLERLENNLWAEIDRVLAKYATHTATGRAGLMDEYKTKSETPVEGGLNVNE